MTKAFLSPFSKAGDLYEKASSKRFSFAFSKAADVYLVGRSDYSYADLKARWSLPSGGDLIPYPNTGRRYSGLVIVSQQYWNVKEGLILKKERR